MVKESKLSSFTTIPSTILLFFLLLLFLIFIVFPPPSRHSIVFPRKGKRPKSGHHIWVWPYRPEFGLLAFSRTNNRMRRRRRDAVLNLASPNVPYKTKKRVLVQEGGGFIEDVLVPQSWIQISSALREKPQGSSLEVLVNKPLIT